MFMRMKLTGTAKVPSKMFLANNAPIPQKEPHVF